MFVSLSRGLIKEKEGAIKNILMTDVNNPQLLSPRMLSSVNIENKKSPPKPQCSLWSHTGLGKIAKLPQANIEGRLFKDKCKNPYLCCKGSDEAITWCQSSG